ncbi:alpha-ketoglutarate-dependent dioxygenase AlkB [Shewanella sp. Scap07]|uniref:alpha-ketoglutarate-dependent dioxygenase AlkB family protein n=1 Tax=Shewanella sp. Scap07 TaxID=2589987 RepID=UPI0015BFB377|nr:alpha-ketoglutarate-dependent dioxygenase AlkB [Shewanella sp. Scap07]QLE86420.1 alpha-ketoglutarate-dependent dioxygenase AlkB [Shewanella sp. Scap07]
MAKDEDIAKVPTQASLALSEPKALSLAQSAAVVDVPITIKKGYLTPKQQALLLREAQDYPYTRPEVEVFGKKHVIPRSQVWFADAGCDTAFSGLMIQAQPWPYYANRLRQQLEKDFALAANGVLINHYANGEQSMGWHSDNEPEFAPNSDIASVSLGASRDFVIRHKDSQYKQVISLAAGDLLIMHWPMQQYWEHALPKRLKVTEARINFTFRQITPNFFNLDGEG